MGLLPGASRLRKISIVSAVTHYAAQTSHV